MDLYLWIFLSNIIFSCHLCIENLIVRLCQSLPTEMIRSISQTNVAPERPVWFHHRSPNQQFLTNKLFFDGILFLFFCTWKLGRLRLFVKIARRTVASTFSNSFNSNTTGWNCCIDSLWTKPHLQKTFSELLTSVLSLESPKWLTELCQKVHGAKVFLGSRVHLPPRVTIWFFCHFANEQLLTYWKLLQC